MNLRVMPYGDRAVLVEPDDPRAVLALAEAAREVGDVIEVVPAARTVLVAVRSPDRAGSVAAALRELRVEVRPDTVTDRPELLLDVTYDGPDLADTAAEVGLDVDGLVRAHAGGEYVVAFGGFAPGFGYLTGLDPALHVPRLSEPRTRVPAGSVAIADEFTGVYPTPSPGGWRLLGHTEAPLWDLDRDPPALLVPATRVRFRATT